MTVVKEYLYQIWNLDREIEIKYRALEAARAQIGVMPRQADPDAVSHPDVISDPTFCYVKKVMKLEAQLNKKIERLITLKSRIISQIDGMDNRTYRNILTCRYVLMQSWDKVAESCGYSVQHIYRMHGKALREFSRLYLSNMR